MLTEGIGDTRRCLWKFTDLPGTVFYFDTFNSSFKLPDILEIPIQSDLIIRAKCAL
jgi:hypothetical protein